MNMRMSVTGREKLRVREGNILKAYRDSVGVWTIGTGHTAGAGAPIPRAGMVISKAEADEILQRDLILFENTVNTAVRVPLTQGQFDALVSFCFNIGESNFKKSTVVKRLNAGNYTGAAAAFMLWVKPPEIKKRRDGERRQFLAGTGGVGHDAAKIVRAVEIAPPAIHAEEAISVDYLRAAGSRTIGNADMVKGVAKTVLGADLVDGATRANEAVQQVQEAYVGFQHGAHVLELVKSYWPLGVGLLITAIIAYLAWRAIRASNRIVAARLEDATFGVHRGYFDEISDDEESPSEETQLAINWGALRS